jgi:hypothetical protein
LRPQSVSGIRIPEAGFRQPESPSRLLPVTCHLDPANRDDCLNGYKENRQEPVVQNVKKADKKG